MPAELREWLASDRADVPDAIDSGRPSDHVTERLLTLVRPLRARRATIAGAEVVHDRDGRPFAAVCDARLLVRDTAVPGTLDTEAVEGLTSWLAIDLFPADIGFTRGTDLLRDVLARAHAGGSATQRTP